MTTIVVDFTGFYIDGQFVIKEFCKAHITPTSIKVDTPLLIDTSKLVFTKDFFKDKIFKEFYERCGIIWKTKSGFVGSDLWVKLKSLLGAKCDIYVRDGKHAKILSNYLGIKYVPFKALTDLDKNFNDVIMRTTCKNHQTRESYCVNENVRNMAQWLKEKLGSPSTIRNNHAVINFTGYYNLEERFEIKELSIYCLDNRGSIVYNELMVAILSDHKDVPNVEKQNYRRNYYDKFGIERQAGNCKKFVLPKKIMRILLFYAVRFVYVKNNARKDILQLLIGSGFEIICLDRYNFVDRAAVDYCGFHTHDQEDKNVCVNFGVQNMVQLLLREELYKEEVRNNFGRSMMYDTDDADSDVIVD